MTYSIDEFKSQVGKSGGFAMNNLFKVYLPPILGESRSMNLLCKAVGIPGRQIQSQEKIMGLVNKKVANGFIVDDVTLTFYLRIHPTSNNSTHQERCVVPYYEKKII